MGISWLVVSTWPDVWGGYVANFVVNVDGVESVVPSSKLVNLSSEVISMTGSGEDGCPPEICKVVVLVEGVYAPQ